MDKKKETYKSHVVLIRQLIKPYQFKTEIGKQVKYYNLKTNKIEQKKVKELDAERKYFDSELEEYLDKFVESPFSDSVVKVKEIIKQLQNNSFTNKDLNVIRKFFQFTILRSKETFKKIFNASIFAPIVENFSHSFAVSFGTSATKEIFKNKRISCIVNKNTEKYGFVCPHNVVFGLFDENYKSYNLAITINNKLIICLSLEQEADDLELLFVDSPDYIRAVNCMTFLTEEKHGNNYIVGHECDLIRLIEDINEIKERDKNKTEKPKLSG